MELSQRAAARKRVPIPGRHAVRAARRDVLMDVIWDASGVHTIATPKVLLVYLIEHVRRRRDYDELRLVHLIAWLSALHDAQPASAKPAVGRAAINRVIDRIVDNYDAVHTIQNSARAG
jgi:hypothetical protein